MSVGGAKPSRRDRKAQAWEIWRRSTADLDAGNYEDRARRVRNLCPCEYTWTVPLWDVIFAACKDPSPVVRVAALHVIEDAYSHAAPDARGMKYLYAALKDPDPGVRRFAADVIRTWPKRQQYVKRKRQARRMIGG